MTLKANIIKKVVSKIYFAFFFCMLFSPLSSYANLFQIPLDNVGGGTWSLGADNLSTIGNGAIIEAKGDVVLQRGTEILKADLVRYYTATGWVFVKGNVEIQSGQDYMTASEAEIDLENFTGFLHDGAVFMNGQHVYMSGDYAEKHFGNVYEFENATLTTCSPDSPLWTLNADKALIDIDGVAQLRSVSASVSVVSTPPIPRMNVSLVEQRQTGFLPPSYSSSDNLGKSITVPFFLAINESHDLTLSGAYYTEDNIMVSAKYRAYPTLGTKWWLAGDYVFTHNEMVDDHYWLRGMGEGYVFESDWRYRVDLDFVSDVDFMLDYRTSYTGHANTTLELFKFFGRELVPLQADRRSAGYIYRTINDIYLTAGFEFIQNPLYGSVYERSKDPTVQVMPQLAAYLFPYSPFDFVPLQIDTSLDISRYYKRYGTSIYSSFFNPRLSLPLDLKYFSLLPQIRLVQRNYIADEQENSAAPLEKVDINDRKTNDVLFDFQMQTMLQASRVWNFDNSDFDLVEENIGKTKTVAFQHRIEPRLTYLFTPEHDQSHLPYYSQEDRFFSQNEFQFALHNVLTTKSESIVQVPSDSDEVLLDTKAQYKTLARFTFGASYDLQEAQRTVLLNEYERKPFRDLTFDADFYVLGLGLSTHLSYSLYGDGVTAFDVSTKIPLFALEKYITWNTQVGYRKPVLDYYNLIRYNIVQNSLASQETTLLTNTFRITPIKELAFNFSHYINLNDTDNYTITAGVDLYHECLHLGFDYVYSLEDSSINLRFTIPGLFE